MKLKEIFEEFIGVFFPFDCHLCRAKTAFGKVLCVVCEKELLEECSSLHELSDIEVDFPVYSLSSYNQKIAEVIRIIKYRPSKRLLKQFSELIRPLVKESAKKLKFDILIPVPMHKKREGLRGFNQAAVFAEIMANSLGASFSPALCRKINTRPQADCDANERKINLVNSIELASGLIKGAFAGKRICLVDDVATTGATLQICKEALLELNPAAIEALVVSHSFMRNEKHSSSNLKG